MFRDFSKCGVIFIALVMTACSKLTPDKTPPLLTIPSEVTIEQYASFEPDKAEAIDNIDGDISSNIEITNNVDVSIPGIYEVVYFVSDSAGNTSTASVNITVEESIPYKAAIRLAEYLMDNLKNPHSMEIYALKYRYRNFVNDSKVKDYIEVYIEYAGVNGFGALTESSGIGEYYFENGDIIETERFTQQIALSKLSTLLGKSSSYSILLKENSSTLESWRKQDTEEINVNTIKLAVGLN